MQFLDKRGLSTFLIRIKKIFWPKSSLTEIKEARRINLLEINYEDTLAFNISIIAGKNSPYVGSAVVGETYVA